MIEDILNNMQKIQVVISFITAIVLLVMIVMSLILKIKKKRKEKLDKLHKENPENEDINKELEELEEEITFLEVVEKTIPKAITIAEKSGALTPETKKLVATAYVAQEMISNGMNYNEYQEEVSKTIDDFVTMTKEVNVEKKE